MVNIFHKEQPLGSSSGPAARAPSRGKAKPEQSASARAASPAAKKPPSRSGASTPQPSNGKLSQFVSNHTPTIGSLMKNLHLRVPKPDAAATGAAAAVAESTDDPAAPTTSQPVPPAGGRPAGPKFGRRAAAQSDKALEQKLANAGAGAGADAGAAGQRTGVLSRAVDRLLPGKTRTVTYSEANRPADEVNEAAQAPQSLKEVIKDKIRRKPATPAAKTKGTKPTAGDADADAGAAEDHPTIKEMLDRKLQRKSAPHPTTTTAAAEEPPELEEARVDKLLLQKMMEMGFTHNLAVRALYTTKATHDTGVEEAAAWAVRHEKDRAANEPMMVPKAPKHNPTLKEKVMGTLHRKSAPHPSAGGQGELEEAVADEALLQEMLEMGFPRNRAVRALCTTNATPVTGVDIAANWAVEHDKDPDIDEPLMVPKAPQPEAPHHTLKEKIIGTLHRKSATHAAAAAKDGGAAAAGSDGAAARDGGGTSSGPESAAAAPAKPRGKVATAAGKVAATANQALGSVGHAAATVGHAAAHAAVSVGHAGHTVGVKAHHAAQAVGHAMAAAVPERLRHRAHPDDDQTAGGEEAAEGAPKAKAKPRRGRPPKGAAAAASDAATASAAAAEQSGSEEGKGRPPSRRQKGAHPGGPLESEPTDDEHKDGETSHKEGLASRVKGALSGLRPKRGKAKGHYQLARTGTVELDGSDPSVGAQRITEQKQQRASGDASDPDFIDTPLDSTDSEAEEPSAAALAAAVSPSPRGAKKAAGAAAAGELGRGGIGSAGALASDVEATDFRRMRRATAGLGGGKGISAPPGMGGAFQHVPDGFGAAHGPLGVRGRLAIDTTPDRRISNGGVYDSGALSAPGAPYRRTNGYDSTIAVSPTLMAARRASAIEGGGGMAHHYGGAAAARNEVRRNLLLALSEDGTGGGGGGHDVRFPPIHKAPGGGGNGLFPALAGNNALKQQPAAANNSNGLSNGAARRPLSREAEALLALAIKEQETDRIRAMAEQRPTPSNVRYAARVEAGILSHGHGRGR